MSDETSAPSVIQQIETDLQAFGDKVVILVEDFESAIVQAFAAGVRSVTAALPGIVIQAAQTEAAAVANAITTGGDVGAAITTASNNVMTTAAKQGIQVGEAAATAAITTFAHALTASQPDEATGPSTAQPAG